MFVRPEAAAASAEAIPAVVIAVTGRDDKGLADGANDVRNEELVSGIIGGKRDVHEAAEKDRNAEEGKPAHIHRFIMSETRGINSSCGKPVDARTLPICSAFSVG